MVVALLVLASFSVVLMLLVRQGRLAEHRQVRQILEERLDRQLAREVARLERSPRLRVNGEVEDRVALIQRALDNMLARSFDELMALERRQVRLRQAVRRARTATERRRAHVQLRRVDKELDICKLWILMLEERRQAVRRLRTPPDRDVEKTPSKTPKTSPSQSSPARDPRVPRLPDWLHAVQ